MHKSLFISRNNNNALSYREVSNTVDLNNVFYKSQLKT